MNVGDYVRTRNGLIFKITGGNVDNWDLDISFDILESFEENWLELYKYNDNGSFFDNKNIVKSSPQIIDLIEVGDYVNGHKVIEVDLDDIDDYGNTFRYIKTEHDYSLNYWVNENEIETIITKEQFDAMQYRVEE